MKRRRLTQIERIAVYQKYDGHCAYCGKPINIKEMQVDHVRPLHIGGADDMDNMVPACRSCNHYKSTLDAEGFRKYLSGLHDRLLRDSVAYKTAERFGIVKHIRDDVTFYMELPEKEEVE